MDDPPALATANLAWVLGATGWQFAIRGLWGAGPDELLAAPTVSFAALVGVAVAVSGVAAGRLSVPGRHLLGALAATVLVTLGSLLLFPGLGRGVASVFAGMTLFVGSSYVVGWSVDRFIRRRPTRGGGPVDDSRR